MNRCRNRGLLISWKQSEKQCGTVLSSAMIHWLSILGVGRGYAQNKGPYSYEMAGNCLERHGGTGGVDEHRHWKVFATFESVMPSSRIYIQPLLPTL